MSVSLTQLQFKHLSLSWTLNQCALELETSSHVGLHDLFEVIDGVKYDDLK